MKRLCLGLLVMMTGAVAATAAPKAPPMTQISVLVGRPARGKEPAMELADGTVIALGTRIGASTAERTLERMVLAQKIEDTFRIRLDKAPGGPVVTELRPGMTKTVQAAGGALTVDVKLTAIAGGTASYEVAFRKGDTVLSSTPVTVAIGGRAVVGARDGETVPFIFVIVEPVLPGKETPLRFAKDPGVAPPKLIRRVQPVYPESARKDRVSGLVVLGSVIGNDGTVRLLTPLKSPDERLTAAAMNAVRQWRFEPARDRGGHPIEVVYVLTVRFTLR